MTCSADSHCRSKCPCVSEQTLCYAAFRGRETARRLSTEADRLLSDIHCAPDICRLLDGDQAVEWGLSRALCSELALIDYLHAQTSTHCC